MEEKENIIYVSLDEILPNRFQPRLEFNQDELNTLADSIKKYGIIQPLVVRQIGEKYEIIAGERRYKASTIAGLEKVPVIVKNTDDNTSAEIALLENIQRKNLTVIEEAQSFKKLLNKGFTQEEIAFKLGISQSSIANKLRLLNLPKEVQTALLNNSISERHARSLLTISDTNKQIELLNKIISEKLTVKQTEEAIKELLSIQSENQNEINNGIQNFLNINPGDNINNAHIKPEKKDDLIERSSEIVTIDFDEIKPSNDEFNIVELNDNIINNNEIKYSEFNDNIENSYMSENNMTPFQVDLNKSISIESEPIKSKEIIQTTIIADDNNEGEINTSTDYEEKNILNEYGEVSLPKLISSFRDYFSSLKEAKNILNLEEIDLNDKYQITITIDKNNL